MDLPQFRTLSDDDTRELHRVWRSFQQRFMKDGEFLYSGAELMEKMEPWLEEQRSVVVAPCDDSYHSSSDIVFIPHALPDGYYWGTTVVIIPQCSGAPPLQMFLYPSHMAFLAGVTEGLRQRALASLNVFARPEIAPKEPTP